MVTCMSKRGGKQRVLGSSLDLGKKQEMGLCHSSFHRKTAESHQLSFMFRVSFIPFRSFIYIP